jgi:hypothetical protein
MLPPYSSLPRSNQKQQHREVVYRVEVLATCADVNVDERRITEKPNYRAPLSTTKIALSIMAVPACGGTVIFGRG